MPLYSHFHTSRSITLAASRNVDVTKNSLRRRPDTHPNCRPRLPPPTAAPDCRPKIQPRLPPPLAATPPAATAAGPPLAPAWALLAAVPA